MLFDPVTALLTQLTSATPPTWSSTSQAELAARWTASMDARALIRLLGFAGDTAAVMRAGCACARVAVDALSGDERPLRAIELAEAWARGEAPLDAVRAAVTALRDASFTSASKEVAAAAAADCAASAVLWRQSDSPRGFWILTASDAAAWSAASKVIESHGWSEHRVVDWTEDELRSRASMFDPHATTFISSLAALADVVRAKIGCPDAEALMRAGADVRNR